MVVCWHNHLNDSVRVRVGFYPCIIPEVCHDVNPIGGDRQISRLQLRMIRVRNAGVLKQLDSQSPVTVP